MSDLATRMNTMRDSLAALYPARVVSRDATDPAQMSNADLTRGVYTLISLAERDYTEAPGYKAQDGRQRILILGDFAIEENQPGSKIEDTEFTMMEEIKAFARNLPDSLCSLSIKGIAQSGQTANPYGWIVVEAEYQP